MDIVIGLPESSVRGFWMAWAGFAVEASAVVARLRRGVACACARAKVRIETGRKLLGADGARTLRHNACEVAPEAALLYVLEDRGKELKGLMALRVAALLATRKQDAHMVGRDAFIAVSYREVRGEGSQI
jgi:hypothetical protein